MAIIIVIDVVLSRIKSMPKHVKRKKNKIDINNTRYNYHLKKFINFKDNIAVTEEKVTKRRKNHLKNLKPHEN